ncbi:Pyridoxal-dependent decarboxylase conserved domain [Rhizoctonia solani]|uniref:Pyridoxal-dependent decarboxylase conserved domain n=1 Tax=Rhizoctonia solani TaxID=456999 RepID=A0A8H7IJU4_9AGAM|nr:Pyridoxal-dependent decarboxylase conserved domain [Rhizoctonia solani]
MLSHIHCYKIGRFEFTSLNPSPSNATVTSQTIWIFLFLGVSSLYDCRAPSARSFGFSVESDVSSSNTSTTSIFDASSTRHDRLGAYQTEHARLAYQPEDPKFIGKEMQASAVFQKEMSELDVALKELVGALSEHSIPFWSPRYNAHMNGDTSLPGLLAILQPPYSVMLATAMQMLGYNISNTESSKPWGHIVLWWLCANLESMWAARNMKFYPLSLACAMEPGAPLDFIRNPETVFDIPERLQSEYAISAGALSTALNPYLIQTCGKDVLEKKFGKKPSKYFVGTTKHYSWPKGAAVTGIGSEHIIDVRIRRRRHHGSTEQAAVDPIKASSAKVQVPASSLLCVHADAAWGGIRLVPSEPDVPQPNGSIVPEQALGDYTRSQLEYLQFADSITIDPHKSGYIRTGGPVLPDGRMRYLVTWTNQLYKDSDGTESMECMESKEASRVRALTYGVAAWRVAVQLHQGEIVWTGERAYTQWRSAERQQLGQDAIRKQREYIRDTIVNRPNEELVQDAKAMSLLHEMVSDLSINAFACNFRLPNGEVNSDVVEANYLNTRLRATGVTKVEDNIYDKPLFIQSSQMDQKTYGVCAGGVQVAAGVVGEQDLDILVNCVMSPFPTVANFTKSVTDAFKRIAHEEIKRYREAKAEDPSAVFMLSTASPVELTSILAGSFKGVLQKRLAAGIELTFSSTFEVSNIQVVKNKRLDSKYLDLSYSDEMYFYLYGTPTQQHIEHILVASKNVQLTSDQVSLDLTEGSISEDDLALWFLPPHTPAFFTPDSQQKITVFRDPHAPGKYGPGLTQAYASTSPIASGKIRFGTMVHTDSVDLNANPLPKGVERPKSRGCEQNDTRRTTRCCSCQHGSSQPSAERGIPKRRVVELESSTLKPGYKVGSSLAMFMIVTLFVLAAFTLCRRF